MRLNAESLGTIVNNRPMIRMLVILGKTDGCPTRKLLKKLGSNELHGLLTIAESEGFIKRERRPLEGKGNHLVCNYLTKKGKALVTIAKQIPG